MKSRKRLYAVCLIGILILLLRSFPRMDISTWSLLLMNDDEADFLRTWARIQRKQLNVDDLLGPCKSCVDGGDDTSCKKTNAHQKTDLATSFVSGEQVKPVGEFSRLVIKTRNKWGMERRSGGDGWQVYLKGPSFLSASVFDLRNGSYEAVFLPVVPGTYDVYLTLVYTSCVGISKPPGTHSSLGQLKYVINVPEGKDHSLLHRLQYHMTFRDCNGRSSWFQYHKCYGCCRSCSFVWNGLGTWENVRANLKWKPYFKIDDRPRKMKYRKQAIRKNGTLWFFGERRSQIFDAVKHGPLCSKVFKNCDSASSFYPKEDLTTLSASRVTELIMRSLISLFNFSKGRPQNALILNSGLIRHLPYDSYTRIVDQISQLIHDTFNDTEHAQVVWSTLTPLPGKCCNLGYSIYNAYTNRKMCKANVPILDVFSLLDSHPKLSLSSHRSKSPANSTLESVERLLGDFFELTADR